MKITTLLRRRASLSTRLLFWRVAAGSDEADIRDVTFILPRRTRARREARMAALGTIDARRFVSPFYHAREFMPCQRHHTIAATPPFCFDMPLLTTLDY